MSYLECLINSTFNLEIRFQCDIDISKKTINATRSIKNFVVISQRIKDKSDGLISYVNYLRNENTPSHKDTKILDLPKANADDFLKKTIINTVNFDNNNKKGGRKVESLAQSFDFVLPPTVPNPTIDQWKLIYRDVLKTAKTTLGLEAENLNVFAEHCFANIHEQKNPHLNLLIPRIYKEQRLEKLDQKRLLGDLKKSFNTAVMLHCNIDFKQYKPQEQNTGKRRKKWQYEQQQSIKAKEELTNERLLLAQDTLAAAQVQERAETAQIKAQAATDVAVKAKADADVAKHDAQHKMGLLAEMKHLFNDFKSSLSDWIKSIKSKDELLEEITKTDTINAVVNIQNHNEYDADMEEIVFSAIEQAETVTNKPDISKNVSRKRRYKP